MRRPHHGHVATSMRRVRPWRQWTLRTRLVLAMAVLTAVALIVANGAGVVLLRSYLIDKVDRQMMGQSHAQSQGPAAGRGGLQLQFRPESGFGPDFRIYQFAADGTQQPVTDPDGVTVSNLGPGPELGGWANLQAHRNTGKPFTVPGADGAPWRVLVTSIVGSGNTSVTALSIRDVQNTDHNLILIDAIVTVLMLLVIGFAAASVVRIGLRPLTHMEQTATEIAGTGWQDGADIADLSRRIRDVDPHTESGRLGMALNAMLVRIEAAVDARTASEQRLRQFLADASHELRTPLTSIQGFAELYRRGGTPPGPDARRGDGSHRERSRPDAGTGQRSAATGAPGRGTHHGATPRRPPRRGRGDGPGRARAGARPDSCNWPRSTTHPTPSSRSPSSVTSDRLRQVATNLVSNALQHTGDDTRIVVRVGRTSHRRPSTDATHRVIGTGYRCRRPGGGL